MAKIKQDPQKLRWFCTELSGHASYWEQTIAGLDASLAQLGDSWEDDQFHSFKKEVETLKRSLTGFSLETRRTVLELESDAEALEKYENIKL